MRENRYDDPSFFDRYRQMPRSTGGLEAAGEWSTLRGMLPDLLDKRVLDLGCGFGWHCRYAAEPGATALLTTGFEITALVEPRTGPDDPEARDELRRPKMLLIAARNT